MSLGNDIIPADFATLMEINGTELDQKCETVILTCKRHFSGLTLTHIHCGKIFTQLSFYFFLFFTCHCQFTRYLTIFIYQYLWHERVQVYTNIPVFTFLSLSTILCSFLLNKYFLYFFFANQNLIFQYSKRTGNRNTLY